jgi:hypothetical protein
LRSRIPRGPIWAAVYVFYDSKPLGKGIKIPPELVPPLGEGSYSRIPYHQFIRPVEDRGGICQVCREKSNESISLSTEKEKIFFCSVAHYFEWWLQSDGEALAFKRKPQLDYDEIRERFRLVIEKLPEYTVIRKAVEKESALEIFREIDELLIASRIGRIDLMHATLYLEHPEFKHPKLQEKISPHLLRVFKELSEVAYLVRSEDPDEDCEIYSRLGTIRAAIEGFLSEDVKARKEIIKEFLEKLRPRSAADRLEQVMDEKMEQYLVKRLELKKKLIVCLCPTEEKQRFYCVDAKDKEKVGTHFDVTKTYHLYLVNNTNHDIRVENGRFVPLKSVYLIEEYPYWMFDWWNDYNLRIGVADVVWFKVKFTIKKYGPEKKNLRMIPVLNKKGYKLKYLLE